MVRVGLVGCGTIGSRVALALNRKYRAVARITALHDTNAVRAAHLQRRLRPRPRVVPLPSLVRQSDLVIEAAAVDAAAPVASLALKANRDVLIMSVGGLLTERGWRNPARRSQGRVFIPSGALAGLDGVKAMAVGRLRRVWLTTRKPPRALAGAPYVRRRGLRLERLKQASVLFEGTPAQVVKAFPQNTNIAASLSLAVGERSSVVPRIRVIADPDARRNVHELHVEGETGVLRCRVESRPSANPKTSELAVLSAIAALDRIFARVTVGT
jgi:aspartate dehydrogenase